MRIKTFLVRFVALLVLTGLPAHGVQAQTLFQKLFGWGGESSAKPETKVGARPVPSLGSFSRASPANASRSQQGAASPDDDRTDEGDEANGAYRTLCVRTCDGYYFPISARVSSRRFARDARHCQSMCGGEAKLFYLPRGSYDIKNMTDLSGRAYGRLPTAFAYRKSLINGCACKAMPWSAAEAARHDHYALVDELDKAQVRNAELARVAAAAQVAAEAAAASAMKQAAAQSAATLAQADASKIEADRPAASKSAEGAGERATVALAESGHVSELDTNNSEAPTAAFLGHLLPATMHEAVAQDPVLTRTAVTKRSRRPAVTRTGKSVAAKATQTASWFATQPKYAWPGDQPTRRR